MAKKLTRDKFVVFKVVIYSAYILLSCKKAVACYRLLIEQLRNNYKVGQAQLSQTILCVLYLLLIFIQLAVFTTEEIRYFYRVLSKHLRLVCYEITFQDREDQKTQKAATPANHAPKESKPEEKKGLLSRASSFASEELAKKMPLLRSLSKRSLLETGTQGLLKRKREGASGLFQLQPCDEQVSIERAQAA